MDATPDGEHAMVAVLKEFADLLHCLHTLPKPSIAAVNGDALRRRRGADGGLRPGGRGGDGADRLPGGPPRPGRRRRHARPDPPGRRPPRPAAPPDGRTDLRRGGPRLGPGQRGHDARRRAWPRRSGWPRVSSSAARPALATTKRLLDETEGRPPNLRGAAAISAVVRVSERGPGGDHGVRREAAATMGAASRVGFRPPVEALNRWATPARSHRGGPDMASTADRHSRGSPI